MARNYDNLNHSLFASGEGRGKNPPMNYLAHSLLAGTTDPLFLAGNLVADAVKGKAALVALPERLQEGIRYHRLVDRETDEHLVFRRTCARFAAPYRRFGGVLTDVFYDHVLARDWDQWSAVSFAEHTSCVADCLEEAMPWLPASFAPIAERIRSGVFFARYATRDGVAISLERMAARMARPTPLAAAIEELDRLDADLTADFGEFFPKLRTKLPPIVQRGG